MKKIIVLGILLLALGWYAETRLSHRVPPTPALAVVQPPSAKTGIKPPRPDAAGRPPAPAKVIPKAPAAAAGTVEMSLQQVLEPNNIFHDATFGVSATYPEGWKVKQAIRWGANHLQNTVFFSPPDGSAAVPSMYYQMYPNGAPASGDAEAMLRAMAQTKETSRAQDGLDDYKNDPDSFVFREVDGHPSLSYFATFTQGNQVQAEYFTRIMGDNGYVMFFVRGPAADVQALIPSVYQMGGTVKQP